jgi:hypothetical protein
VKRPSYQKLSPAYFANLRRNKNHLPQMTQINAEEHT